MQRLIKPARLVLFALIFVVVLVLILNGAERRIPVQYSKKMVGRRMVGGQSSHIPLKVNTAGVIPIIFAASLMSFPSIIVSFTGAQLEGSSILDIAPTIVALAGIAPNSDWEGKSLLKR